MILAFNNLYYIYFLIQNLNLKFYVQLDFKKK